MKTLILIFTLALSINTCGQTIVYSWDKKSDSSWISSNSSENTLSYQGFNNDHNGVSTSFSNKTFNHNQITIYTSPIYDFKDLGGTLNVQMILGIKLKDLNGNKAYDWLYFQYSLDGGISWINPVKNSDFVNYSNIDLNEYSLGYNSKKGWSGNLSEHEVCDYKVQNTGKNQFRYIFVSNSTINQGNGNGDIYHADIRDFSLFLYNPLPIHYIDFVGFNQENINILKWTTLSEENNDYFIIQRSLDGITYDEIGRIYGAENSKFAINYEFKDENPNSGINYYRFVQYDYDGKNTNSKVISVDNTGNKVTIVAIYDLSGREVSKDFEGVKIIKYSNGAVIKTLNINNN